MLEFANRIVKKDLIIKKFKYWSIAVRTKQVNIGSCIIVLNRECPTLPEVTPEEMAEYPVVCKYFEEKCQELYGAEKFNYLALMMVDEYVHFHAIPRYSKPIEKYGITWEDRGWPKHPDMKGTETTQEQLLQIKEDFLKE